MGKDYTALGVRSGRTTSRNNIRLNRYTESVLHLHLYSVVTLGSEIEAAPLLRFLLMLVFTCC